MPGSLDRTSSIDTFKNIAVDGNLADWTQIDRLDVFPSQQIKGYLVDGKTTTDSYAIAIQAAEAIGINTTIWLNTDGNNRSGYRVFGSTVGAEYNLNIAADGNVYLYSGGAGQTFVGQVEFAFSSDRQTLEVKIPKTSITLTGTEIKAAIDINDRVFLPGDYASNSLNLSAAPLPSRTDESKRIAIVYSETSANNFFDKKAYAQLFTVAQSQAYAAGVPFDLITDIDLKDLSKIVNYDALVFPSFINVNSADLSAIETSLTQAVTKYGIGIVTSGDFMTNDETGAALAGDSYSRMKNLLGVQRTTGGGVVNAVVTAKDVTSGILSSGYTSGEQILNYDKGTAFAVYSAVTDTGTSVLAEQTVNGNTYNAIVATTTGGNNVHFANQAIFADSNIVSQAIESIVYKNDTQVSLALTRNNSLFLSRDDVDRSKYSNEAPTIESNLTTILSDWKTKYGFVGSHYINIGNDAANGEYTDWSVMAPIYQSWLALGNEIGTHSYTHPFSPSNLTATETEFEFNQSKTEIERNLGIKVTGAATPGNPDSLSLDNQLDGYFQYYTGVGTAYNTAAGFLSPTANAVYFAPNISFDFNAIGYQSLTSSQTEALWKQEYTRLTNHSDKPIIEFAWHDYGVTGTNSTYDPAIYERFIATAAADGTEFVTYDDAQNRIRSFNQTTLTIDRVGNTITAAVTPDTSTTGVGKFSLDIESTQQIKNVTNYYAFDSDSVFLTKTGGNYTINLGAIADNVTHIVALPQRAELLSVTGDGQNLEYTFNGEGKISIDLNLSAGRGVTVVGASSYTLTDNRLEMIFDTTGVHTASVSVGTNNLPMSGNDLRLGGIGNDTLVGVDLTSSTAGQGEIDTLTRAGAGDTFVLGDAKQIYYNNGNSDSSGVNDYANIVGFSTAAGDAIQLQGTAADYALDAPPIGSGSGTAIYHLLLGQPELIAIVQDVAGLNLTDSYFNYI